jgi:hypothetical protein
MSNNVKRPKRSNFKDEAIDVEDLANMSNMGGMLSFLDTKPEDYARLFAKAAEVEALAHTRVEPETSLAESAQAGTTQARTTQRPTTQVDITQVDTLILKEIEETTQKPTTQATPTQETSSQTSTTQDRAAPIETASPESSEARPILVKKGSPGFRSVLDISSHVYPSGQEPEEESTQVEPTQPPTTRAVTTQAQPTKNESLPTIGLSPTVSLGQGRIHQLKIREAKIVQDGHTGSEQMVYDFLWRTGTALNANLRSIRIGRWGIANAVHISDTTAKAALKGLIEKLAIDRIGGSKTVLGFEYHVHSWGSCLTRRKERGLTHVIKSKGVVFVNPETGKPLTGYFFPGPKLGTTQAITTQGDSFQTREPTRVVPAQEGWVENAPTTQVVTSPTPYNHLPNQNAITTTCVREELEKYTVTDEIGVKALIRAVQDNAPDATWPELQHFVREKAKVFQKANIDNRFGFLIVAVPRCFESPSFQRWRQAGGTDTQIVQQRLEEAAGKHFMYLQHLRTVLMDPDASEEEKQSAQEVLDALEG